MEKMVNQVNEIKLNEPKRIKSYVILDLETTGLPYLDFNRTKVTEISLLSVSRKHILEKFQSNQKSGKTDLDYIPRTINKLTECIYPSRMISREATDITGLSNALLEPFQPFNETLFNILMGCLDRLSKPICIIAHNGFRFDFPILSAEINNLGKVFPDDVMCADSLVAFKDLLKKTPYKSVLDEIVPLNEQEILNETINWDSDSDEYNEALVFATLVAENCDTTNTSPDVKRNCTYGDWSQKNNETTPKRTITTNIPQIRKKSQEVNNVTPPTAMKNKAKKRLAFNASDTPKSFKLDYLYEYLTHKTLVNAHKAESDTLALLECMTAIGPSFLDWIDENNKPFNSIKKLW